MHPFALTNECMPQESATQKAEEMPSHPVPAGALPAADTPEPALQDIVTQLALSPQG